MGMGASSGGRRAGSAGKRRWAPVGGKRRWGASGGVSRAAGALDVAFGRVWNGGMCRGVGYLYCAGARR